MRWNSSFRIYNGRTRSARCLSNLPSDIENTSLSSPLPAGSLQGVHSVGEPIQPGDLRLREPPSTSVGSRAEVAAVARPCTDAFQLLCRCFLPTLVSL